MSNACTCIWIYIGKAWILISSFEYVKLIYSSTLSGVHVNLLFENHTSANLILKNFYFSLFIYLNLGGLQKAQCRLCNTSIIYILITYFYDNVFNMLI